MMMEDIHFRITGPKTTLLELNALESSLNADLPVDYRSFLLTFNGGISDLLECQDPYLLISDWFSICGEAEEVDTPLNSIMGCYQLRRRDHGPDLLGIGWDYGGKWIMIKLRGDWKHCIFRWDWEVEGPNEATKIFDSFSGMIEKLEYSKDEI